MLAGYLAAGVAETWPRATYLAGTLPVSRDDAGYAFDLWWVAHQLTVLGNPWHTTYMYAPVGTTLGLNTLMPLLGWLLAPVTEIAGAGFSLNLLAVVLPGLAAYAMLRAARLWTSSIPAAIATGALFGFSTVFTWHSWYQVNLAAGAVFLPIALEASVRLSRRPTLGRAIVLGAVLGASLLVDQEMFLLVAVLAALVLLLFVLRGPFVANLKLTLAAAVAAAVIAAPQLWAISQSTGGTTGSQQLLAESYTEYGISLAGLFAPSPRLATFGLAGAANLYASYSHEAFSEGIATFGVTLTLMGIGGLVIRRRERNARLLGLLWLGTVLLALGPVLHFSNGSLLPFGSTIGGVAVSNLMPFTWFTHLPGVSGFREPERFVFLGLVPATLLAGSFVAWLLQRRRLVTVPIVVLCLLELGYAGSSLVGTMPVGLPALDGPIAAQHSSSIVVDVPLGFRGGMERLGPGFDPEALLLGTIDGHPRAVGYDARLSTQTIAQLDAHPFYSDILDLEFGGQVSAAAAARGGPDARAMDVGWVLVWEPVYPALRRLLDEAGFRFDYEANGVSVFTPTT